MKKHILQIIIALCIGFCGYLIGSQLKHNVISEAKADPIVAPLPAPYIDCQRMYAYGKTYVIFTSSSGGLFVIRD